MTHTPYHVYAESDGYESAHRSLEAAKRTACRGRNRRHMTYLVIQCDTYGLTGGGHGTVVYTAEASEAREAGARTMTKKLKFPSAAHVAHDLRIASRSCDYDVEGVDVRLQVYPDGRWAIRVGMSDYDQDHRGYWGAASVPGGNRRFNSNEVAKELIDQAHDHYYANND